MEKLINFLFENGCCLNCTPISYCGVFTNKETCLECIKNGLNELLQHNVSNNEVAVCATCDKYWSCKDMVGPNAPVCSIYIKQTDC